MALNLVMPAASSMIARRSCGRELHDLADPALLDDRVGLGADAGAEEEVGDVAQAARRLVDEVLRGAVAEQAARDRDLGVAREVERRRLVREQLRDLLGSATGSALPSASTHAAGSRRSAGCRSSLAPLGRGASAAAVGSRRRLASASRSSGRERRRARARSRPRRCGARARASRARSRRRRTSARPRPSGPARGTRSRRR